METKREYPNRIKECVSATDGKQSIDTDPLGSYTGVADNPWEKPVQDADDL